MLKYMTIGIFALVAAIMGYGGNDHDSPAVPKGANTIVDVNSSVGFAYDMMASRTDDEYFTSTLLNNEIRDKIKISKSKNQSITYTISSSKSSRDAVITLQFLPSPRKKGQTIISGIFSAPAVKMKGSFRKYLSQNKIAIEAKKSLKKVANAISQGRSSSDSIKEFNNLLETVTIALNPELQDGLGSRFGIPLAEYDSDSSMDSNAEGWGQNRGITGRPTMEIVKGGNDDGYDEDSEVQFGDPAFNGQ